MKTQTVRIDNFDIAYLDSGTDRRPLVFIHGLPTCKEMFLPLMERLQEDFRVIAPDLVDYGESSRAGRHVSHPERGRHLASFLEALGLKDVILAAHDLGASITMNLLEQAPERIGTLVIMSPPVYPDFRVPAVVKLARSRILGPLLLLMIRKYMLRSAVQKGLVNRSAYQAFLQEPLESAFSGSPGRRALMRNLRWGFPKTEFAGYPAIIRNIAVPTLVIHGSRDPYIPVSHSRRLASDIDVARLHIVEEGSHFLPVDTPAEIESVMKRFLS